MKNKGQTAKGTKTKNPKAYEPYEPEPSGYDDNPKLEPEVMIRATPSGKSIRYIYGDKFYGHLSTEAALALADWVNEHREELTEPIRDREADMHKLAQFFFWHLPAMVQGNVVCSLKYEPRDILSVIGQEPPHLPSDLKYAETLFAELGEWIKMKYYQFER